MYTVLLPPGDNPTAVNKYISYHIITRLASKEIFSPSNKIHREVGRAKDLSAPRYNKNKNYKEHPNAFFLKRVI